MQSTASATSLPFKSSSVSLACINSLLIAGSRSLNFTKQTHYRESFIMLLLMTNNSLTVTPLTIHCRVWHTELEAGGAAVEDVSIGRSFSPFKLCNGSILKRTKKHETVNHLFNALSFTLNTQSGAIFLTPNHQQVVPSLNCPLLSFQSCWSSFL